MVIRCICCDQTFARAVAVAGEHGCRNVAQLKRHLAISEKCGLCIPYVQRAIETGRAEIPLMNEAETIWWSERSGLEDMRSLK